MVIISRVVLAYQPFTALAIMPIRGFFLDWRVVSLITTAHMEKETIEEVVSTETETAEETAQKNERNWKKEYYQEYWTRKQIEKKVSDLEQKFNTIQSTNQTTDYGDYNKEQVEFIEKLAEKKAEQLIDKKLHSFMDNRQNQELVSKEQEAFLDQHPEAIDDLDRIKDLQRQYFPGKSISYVYKKFFNEQEEEQPKNKGVKLSWWSWWWDVTKVNPKKQVTDDDLRAFYWKLVGR